MPNTGVSRTKRKLAWLFLLLAAGVLPSMASAVPKVIVISLDGATPRLVDEQMQNARAIPSRAKEVVVVPTLGSPQAFNGDSDKLSVKLLTRIGTNPDDTKCPGGHAGAVGLRAYFDAVGRASRLDVGLEEN